MAQPWKCLGQASVQKMYEQDVHDGFRDFHLERETLGCETDPKLETSFKANMGKQFQPGTPGPLHKTCGLAKCGDLSLPGGRLASL